MTLHALSPLDGRYEKKTAPLRDYFSEFAYLRTRARLELDFLSALSKIGICPPVNFSLDVFTDDALKIQEYEKTTRHDVKAIEYFLREKIEAYHSEQRKESPANEQETPRQRTLSENQTTEEQLSSIE
jgi:adenylosuccinate lyase